LDDKAGLPDILLSRAIKSWLVGTFRYNAKDPARGKGKRGGFRYLYYYIERDEQIFLLIIFSKNEMDNLTAEQKKQLKKNIIGLREAKR